MEEVLVNRVFNSLDFPCVCCRGDVAVVAVSPLEASVLRLEVLGVDVWRGVAVEQFSLWGGDTVHVEESDRRHLQHMSLRHLR